MLANIFVDVGAPEAKKRADDGKIDIGNLAHCYSAHGAQARGSRAAKQIDQKCFDQIVGVMAQKNGLAFLAFRDSGEKRIPRRARSSLDRHFVFRSQHGDVGRANRQIEIEFGSEFLDEARVGLGRLAA